MTLKRKIENSGNSLKASKVQVVDAKKKAEVKKKPLTKSEIILNFKALEEKYETLQEKHDALEKKHENLVKEKERNLTGIGSQIPLKLSTSLGTQTKAEYVEISCTECIFLASSEEELNYHMYEGHDMDCISYFDTDYPCSVCDRWCKSEKDLNRHIKVYHGNRIKLCSLHCNICDENVSDGEEESIESESTHIGIQKNNFTVKCNFCDVKFATRRCLMVHKKEVLFAGTLLKVSAILEMNSVGLVTLLIVT